MSLYSGKCDLADHIAGLGGWFDKDCNRVKIGDPNVHVYYSDEMLDFIEFKKRTKGVIHQHKHLKVDLFNQDFIAQKNPNFKVIKHVNKKPDKRNKNGYREIETYTYKYYNKEYTLKEINKKGVYISIDIHFDTLLDLIQYYPYIVSSCCSCNGEEEIYISQNSYVEEEYDSALQFGRESTITALYRKDLQRHYQEVVLRYFNPEGRELIEEINFDENGVGYTKEKIDPNFEIEWYFEKGQSKPHWTSPKVVDYDLNKIQMSDQDYNHYLGNKVKVKYVKYKEHPLYLW